MGPMQRTNFVSLWVWQSPRLQLNYNPFKMTAYVFLCHILTVMFVDLALVPWRSSFSSPLESSLLDTKAALELVVEQLLRPHLPDVCRCISLCWSRAANPRAQPEVQLSLPHSPARSLEEKFNCWSIFICSNLKCEVPFSIPGIPVFQWVKLTEFPFVHTNSSMLSWLERPSQKCLSGLKPTKLIRNALSTLGTLHTSLMLCFLVCLFVCFVSYSPFSVLTWPWKCFFTHLIRRLSRSPKPRSQLWHC